MRLLVLTQKVDKNDDVLGFFHGWLLTFSKFFKHITVVCLEKGEYTLPENVEVLSLGKEIPRPGPAAAGRALYAGRFYRYVWRERKNHDAVFVHMNQEYVLLGGLLWRVLGKKVALWYNHTYGTVWTRIAALLSHIVFHTSPFAFTARFRNAVQMPAGIDTELFKNSGVKKEPFSLLFIGRISPVKNVHILFDAAKKLSGEGIAFLLNVYGSALKKDAHYEKDLRKRADGIPIAFHGSVPNHKTPEIYNTHEVCINLTPAGNYDKTVLEAMACESLVLVSSEAFEDALPFECRFKEGDAEDLKEKIKKLFNTSFEEKQELGKQLRDYVVKKHSVDALAYKLQKKLE